MVAQKGYNIPVKAEIALVYIFNWLGNYNFSIFFKIIQDRKRKDW